MQAVFCHYVKNVQSVGKKRAEDWVIYQEKKLNTINCFNMKWFIIIVLIVIAYLAIGSVVGGLIRRWDFDDEDGLISGLTVPFWPIVIPIIFITWGCCALMDWIANYKK